MSSTTFPPDELSAGKAVDRRLSVAIVISFVIHALTLAMFRGFVPAVHISGDGGAGSLPALYATLAGPVASPTTEEPPPPELAIEPQSIAASASTPVVSSGSQVQASRASGAGTRTNLPSSADIHVSVGTIADPAQLGPEYAAQLAQRFPAPVQKPPELRGFTPVDYPREALERGLQGRFAVVIDIDALGNATNIELVTRDPLFGPAILDALKRMEFAAAQDDGKPVPYWVIVKFVFTIGNPEPNPSPYAAQATARRGVALPRQPVRRR